MEEKKLGQAINGSFELIRNKTKENIIVAKRNGSIDLDDDSLSRVFAIFDSTLTQCLPNVLSAVKRAGK
tara:strand:- start:69 stop:275 length:207 start_codon:yes stop_codon:yes gene_type:complete